MLLALGIVAALFEESLEVIRAIWLNQQPGYLEIHRDMVECEIPVPKEIVSWNGELPHPQSDRRKLDEAVRDTAERLSRAQRPLVLVGIEAYRFKAAREIVKLVEKMGVPCCTSVLAKGAFPMNHPLFMGVYAGAISPPIGARDLSPLRVKYIRASQKKAQLKTRT